MDLLRNFFENVAHQEITPDQVQAVLDLQYADGSPVFDVEDVEDRDTKVEILSMFKKLEYDEVMDYLRTVSSKPKDISRLVLESPLMEDARISLKNKREILSRDPPGAKTVAGKCYRCGNEQLLMSSLQTRSGDEGMTNIYFCPQCRNTWKN